MIMKIPLSSPDITDKERKRVLEVLDTPHLSLGPKLAEFEEKFAQYTGSRYAIAVNSGTSALHLCVKAIDLKKGDEVVTTPFSFVASSNCLLFEGARPVFVDIDEKTWNIDINKLSEKIKKLISTSKKLRGILPVHIFGRPCEIHEIRQLADQYDLKLIEDACEAIGAKIRKSTQRPERTDQKKGSPWKKVGTFGDCGVFAFYPNKQMTTGEGGMIVTDNKRVFHLCRSFRNQGRSESGSWLQHERIGYNYRISDINCALGIAQLKRIDEILAKREKVASFYNQIFKEIEELITPQFEVNKKISWFVYVLRLKDNYSREDRDHILIKLRDKGIGCSDYFSPIHLQPFYRKIFGYKRGDFPITEKISERTLALPFYNNLGEEQIEYVCNNLKKIVRSRCWNGKSRRSGS
jgi:perosamine synthetase